jgi:hypothetical protein
MRTKGIVTPIAAFAPAERPVAIGAGLGVVAEPGDVDEGNEELEDVDEAKELEDVDEAKELDRLVDDEVPEVVVVTAAKRSLDCHIIGIPSQDRVTSLSMLHDVRLCRGVVELGMLSRTQRLEIVTPELKAIVQP